ncbi:MAG: hypothetical protein HUU46_10515 [Candidatus Hydrogenedentes bacterium]|nr:hypothetical protein [Candidatus Hydrogenedentota bacterium]
MRTDVAIEEIRQTRHEISERFGHDTYALIAHYQALESKYADRLVKSPARELSPGSVTPQDDATSD